MEKQIKCQACNRLLTNKAVVYRNHGYEDYYCTIDCLKSKVFQENVMLEEMPNLYFKDIDGNKQCINLKEVKRVDMYQDDKTHWLYHLELFDDCYVPIGDYHISLEVMNALSARLNQITNFSKNVM